MIEVLTADVADVLHAAEQIGRTAGIGDGAALVDDHDRAAARSRVHAADARRTLAGRIALRLLVSFRLGRPSREAAGLEVDRTCTHCGAPHGKARVAGVSVSGSTSGTRVLVAVADSGTHVGADVQEVPPRLWRGFDAFTLHPNERHALASGQCGLTSRIALWTEKEAVLKAAGHGLRSAPSAIELYPPSSTDPARWRPVVKSEIPEVGGMQVLTLATTDLACSAVAASRPEIVRRRSLADVIGPSPT